MKVLRKLREENGSITMTVVAAMLLIIACITIAFMSIFNKNISQNSKIRIIEKNYADSSSNEKIKEQYNDTLNRLNSIINVRLYKSSSGEEYSVDQWTNDNLKLNITWDIPIPEEYKYFFYNGVQTGYSDNYEINENCTISVGYGNDKKIIEITKLDKNIPQYTIAEDVEYNPDGTSKESNTLITYLGDNKSILTGISVEDNESGIAPDGVKCYKNNSEISTTDFFTQVGRYEVDYKVKDNAGNETTLKRDVLVRWPVAGKYIIAKQNVVGEGLATGGQTSGLYKDNLDTGLDSTLPFSSKYYYSGNNVNNNISFAGKTYNVINISVNDDLKIISDISSKSIGWGNKQIYNSTIYQNWIGDFSTNRHLYDSSDSKNYVFSENEWSHIDRGTFYAGRFERNTNDTLANTINLERTSVYRLGGDSAAFNSLMAYPNVSDYLKACNYMDLIYNIRSSQTNGSKFKNYSWLASNEEQWTINSKRDDSSLSAENDFWILNKTLSGNEILSWDCDSIFNRKYRPVFYLKNNTILSGAGTTSDPFTVQENWAWFDSYQQKQ